MGNFPNSLKLRSVQPEFERQIIRANEDGTITVHIPIILKKDRPRHYIVMPDLPQRPQSSKPRASILKAIAQAFRWKEMIDKGEISSMKELATQHRVNESYAARIFRLTLLAPDIIEALLNGTQPQKLTLNDLLKPIPYDWNEQRVKYGFANQRNSK